MSVYGGQVASRVAHGPAGGQRGDDRGPVDEVRHSGRARVYPREVDAGGAAGQVAAPPRDLQTRGFWQLSLSTDAPTWHRVLHIKSSSFFHNKAELSQSLPQNFFCVNNALFIKI